MSELTPSLVRTLVGHVTANTRDKTCTVAVDWSKKHPQYGKVMRGKTRYHIHDEENTCKVGDRVRIKEGRPVSKTKTWYLVEVLEKAEKTEVL
jgi:small subunit ribosomal protein S17